MLHHGTQWQVKMVIYTVRLGRWKAAKKQGIPVIDISLNNNMWIVLKPTREVLKLYADKPSVFAHEFTHQLINSYRDNKQAWLCILRNSKVALGTGQTDLENLYTKIIIDFINQIAINHGLVIQHGGELQE